MVQQTWSTTQRTYGTRPHAPYQYDPNEHYGNGTSGSRHYAEQNVIRPREHPHPLFEDSEYDNLGFQYFGGGRQNYAGLESGLGPLASQHHQPELYGSHARHPLFDEEWQPGGGEDHRGSGPKNYQRSDQRIHEELCERLTDDPYVDVSDVSVTVQDGVVTFEGNITGRQQKYRIEDIAEHCRGVKDVQNRVMVSQRPPTPIASSAVI